MKAHNTIKLAIISLACILTGVAGRDLRPNVLLLLIGCVGLLAALSTWENQ